MADDRNKAYYNRVRFLPRTGGEALAIQMDGNWTLQPGVKPSIFTATCAYTEFVKLGDDLANVWGSLAFHFSSGDDADLILADFKLVDVEPRKLALVEGGAGLRHTEFRLAFADRRQLFAPPFGGVLVAGEINKLPLDPTGVRDANKRHVMRRLEMARMCLAAMGVEAQIPHELSDMPPVMNVDWRGNPAAEELEKLLTEVGFTFVVLPDGSFRIVRLGVGDPPKAAPEGPIPAGRQFMDAAYPGVDRTGGVVVFSSAPLATVETKDYDMDDFEWVILDSDDTWQTLDKAKLFKGHAPADVMRWMFDFSFDDGRDDNPFHVEAQYKDRVLTYLYSALRLKADVHGPQPMTRFVFEKDAHSEIRVTGWALVEAIGETGLVKASDSMIEVPPIALLDNGRVLHLPYPMVRLPNGKVVGRLKDGIVELTKNDLKVRLTRERWEPANSEAVFEPINADWRPVFFRIGFKKELGGTVTRIDKEKEVDNLLAQGAGYISRPELRQYLVDGLEVNKTQLQVQSRSYAQQYLVGTVGENSQTAPAAARIGAAVGFVRIELSGIVNEVSYSAEPPATQWKMMGWSYPHDIPLNQGQRFRAFGEPFPKGNKTAGQRTAEGVASGQQPVAALVTTRPQFKETWFVGRIKGRVQGVHGVYRVERFAGGVETSAALNYSIDFGQRVVDVNVIVVNLPEVEAAHQAVPPNDPAGALDGHWWWNGSSATKHLFHVVGSADDGTLIAVAEMYNPHETFPVLLTFNSGADGDIDVPCAYAYDVTDLQGNPLGRNMRPVATLRPIGPTNGASGGLGYYADGGTFVLWHAFEAPRVILQGIKDETGATQFVLVLGKQ